MDFDREAAKAAGYTDAEIDAFLGKVAQPQAQAPAPVPTPIQQPPPQLQSTPDMVSPFKNNNVVQTQGFGENPWNYPATGGHAGEDYAYVRSPEIGSPTTEDELRASIGGLVLSGYQPQGFGNVSAVVGANPQELAQMSPEEKQALQAEFEANLPTASSLKDFPSLSKYENVNLVGHGGNQPLPSGTEVATGSALLKEGSTGWSDAPHSHIEMMQKGNLKPFMDILRKMQYR